MGFEFEKRTLADGWVEVRFVTHRPVVTPDFKRTGQAARAEIAQLFLAGAAGVCDMLGYPQLSGTLGDVWSAARKRFGVEGR